MNLLLVYTLLVIGMFGGSHAVCSSAACGVAPGDAVTSCSVVSAYWDCLKLEVAGCTTAQLAEGGDGAGIPGLITTISAKYVDLSCSGAGMASISATTLLLSLVATYFKS